MSQFAAPSGGSRAATRPARATRALGAITLGGWALLLGASCSHDWDAFDPRLGSGGATGGAGGTTSSAGGTGGTTSSTGGGGSTAMGGSGGTGGTGGVGAMGGSGGTGGTGGGTVCTPNLAVPCYTGPDGTEGMGICAAGQMICENDGMSYGPCLGEVTPSIEECSLPGDEDCNGIANDKCAIWAKQYGNSGEQRAIAIAVDAAGNILITGRMAGTMVIGGSTLVSAGNYDVFVIKLGPTGLPIWGKVFGDVEDQEPVAIAVDPSGNVLVTGFYYGTIDFSGGMGPAHTNTGFEDGFVVKLDPNGNYVWSKSIGGVFAQYGHAIAADTDGSVIVGGSFDGLSTFDSDMYTSIDVLDAFVWKLSADGGTAWIKTFGDLADDEVLGLTTDSANHVYATGYFDEMVDFGKGPIVDGGGTDIFLVEIDPNGNYVFGKGYPAAGGQGAHSIARDTDGNLLLAGTATSEINFGGGAIPTAGSTDVFVAKVSPMGDEVWAKLFGDAVTQQNSLVGALSTGDVMFACTFEGTIDFGGGLFDAGSTGSSDVGVVRLDSATGAHIWSRRFGDPGDQDVRGIAIGPGDNTLITGEFGGFMHFGVTELDNVSGDDIFVAKLPP